MSEITKKTDKQNTIKIIVIISLYMIWFYALSILLVEQDLLISIRDITRENIVQEFTTDFLVMMLFTIILLMAYRKKFSEFEFRIRGNKEAAVFLLILTAAFLWNRDFTIRGFYELFFYTIVVAFCEEVIFRGYMYNQLKKTGKIRAVIISGAFFGAMHALLPAAIEQAGFIELLYRILNEIGGGIFNSFMFVLFLEAGHSLWIPILIHAIFDYGGALPPVIRIVFYLGTITYYAIKYKRRHST